MDAKGAEELVELAQKWADAGLEALELLKKRSNTDKSLAKLCEEMCIKASGVGGLRGSGVGGRLWCEPPLTFFVAAARAVGSRGRRGRGRVKLKPGNLWSRHATSRQLRRHAERGKNRTGPDRRLSLAYREGLLGKRMLQVVRSVLSTRALPLTDERDARDASTRPAFRLHRRRLC